jgi:Lhr-like helicase
MSLEKAIPASKLTWLSTLSVRSKMPLQSFQACMLAKSAWFSATAGRRRRNSRHCFASLGVRTFVSHSSLSADERRQAEKAFAEEPNCVIVATSTLELGIDVGDLDRVIQIDAPGSVASFLQRMGRTGRRTGTMRNCMFLGHR